MIVTKPTPESGVSNRMKRISQPQQNHAKFDVPISTAALQTPEELQGEIAFFEFE